jgi:hypothetical protein
MKTFKDFKIRASKGGALMGIKALGKTGESYLQQWLKEQIYERKKEFSNKYTQKGLIVEDNSLDFAAEQLQLGMLIKNEQYFENEYFCGTPDIITKDFILDIKNSWDAFTFPLFEDELPNSDYYIQGQIYMALVGLKKYKVVYTLIDTPEHLIKKAAYYYCNDNGIEFDESILKEFTDKMTYSNVDPKYRIKVFEFEYDQPTIDKLISRVEESRIYLSTLPI